MNWQLARLKITLANEIAKLINGDGPKSLCSPFAYFRGQIPQIVRLFALDLEATKVAYLCHLSRRTINRFFHAFRRMAQECEAHAPVRGTISSTNPTSGAGAFGANRAAGPAARPSSSASSSVAVGSTRRSFPMPNAPLP